MYTLDDRGGATLALRPEGTAGLVRALVSNKSLPVPARAAAAGGEPVRKGPGASSAVQRYHYCGPMFRYERPQRGRYRQFTQFGVEMLSSGGVAGGDGREELWADVDCLRSAEAALGAVLGKEGRRRDVQLLVNSLGDAESRAAYSRALTAFLTPRVASLSADSQQRVARGAVLRVLDSKDEADRALLEDAPPLADSLTPSAAARFDALRGVLDSLAIPYRVDQCLVRGLDYYSHTIFEYVVKERPREAVLAGGRYDTLVAALGGSAGITGIGWAAGVEVLFSVSPPHNTRTRFALTDFPSPQRLVDLAGDEMFPEPEFELDATFIALASYTQAPLGDSPGDAAALTAALHLVHAGTEHGGLACEWLRGTNAGKLIGRASKVRCAQSRSVDTDTDTERNSVADALPFCRHCRRGRGRARHGARQGPLERRRGRAAARRRHRARRRRRRVNSKNFGVKTINKTHTTAIKTRFMQKDFGKK